MDNGKLIKRAQRELPAFLMDLDRIVDSCPDMTDSQRVLAKGFLRRRQENLVLCTDVKSISISVLPGGLSLGMRNDLSEKLLPMFLAFNSSVRY